MLLLCEIRRPQPRTCLLSRHYVVDFFLPCLGRCEIFPKAQPIVLPHLLAPSVCSAGHNLTTSPHLLHCTHCCSLVMNDICWAFHFQVEYPDCINLTFVGQFAGTQLSWHCWVDFLMQQMQMTVAKAWESHTCICRGTGISQALVVADADLFCLLLVGKLKVYAHSSINKLELDRRLTSEYGRFNKLNKLVDLDQHIDCHV